MSTGVNEDNTQIGSVFLSYFRTELGGLVREKKIANGVIRTDRQIDRVMGKRMDRGRDHSLRVTLFPLWWPNSENRESADKTVAKA